MRILPESYKPSGSVEASEKSPGKASDQLAWRGNIRTAIEFIFKNFATPVVFFCVFQFYGSKPAIAFALLVTIFTLGVHRIKKVEISPFFLVAAGFTVVFGSVDLFVQTPRFFRLEPFAQNSLMSLVFFTSVIIGKPIAAWFVAALPELVRPKLAATSSQYLRNVTLAWATYFVLKGLLFLYIALRVDLGRLMIFRTLIGGSSMAAMFGGEIFYRRYLWQRRE